MKASEEPNEKRSARTAALTERLKSQQTRERLASKDRGHDLRDVLRARTPQTWVTYALAGANVAVFGAMVAGGVSPVDPQIEDALRWGADFGPLTTGGQWWRLLTNAFVHFGGEHLVANMIGLLSFGVLVERLYGSRAFLTLYVASALAGSLTSLSWNPFIVSAGASGAIFGVIGAALAAWLPYRKTHPRWLFWPEPEGSNVFRRLLVGRLGPIGFLGYNLVLGLFGPIDQAAHLGGLAGGFMAGTILRTPLESTTWTTRLPLRRLAWVVVALAGLGVLARTRAITDPDGIAYAGQAACDRGDWAAAVECFDRYLVRVPDDVDALVSRGFARSSQGDYRGAIADCDLALGLSPEHPQARELRTWCWLRLRASPEEPERDP